jgi:hypothetical protein
VVFLSSSCDKKTAKNAIKKIEGKKRQDFPPQLLWQKVLNGVFELPLLRNAQNRHQKKVKIEEKKPTYPIWTSSGYLPDIRRFQLFVFQRPLIKINKTYNPELTEEQGTFG